MKSSRNADVKSIQRATLMKAEDVEIFAKQKPTKINSNRRRKAGKEILKEHVSRSLKMLNGNPVSAVRPVIMSSLRIKKGLEKTVRSGNTLKDLNGLFIKKKERKLARKSQSNNFELSQKSKQLWEKVRRMDCTKTRRVALCQELYNLVKDKVKELLMAHDTSRVIECLLVLGSEKIRSHLYSAVKDDLLLLMKSKYSKFFVIKLLKFGTKQQKDAIIKSMHGRITSLIRHSEAANVVEYAYNEYANAQQRASFTEEFYGLSFALFKDSEVKSLGDILAKQPCQKEIILTNMKATLNAVLNKPVMQHSIIHHMLLEYLTHCNESDRMDMIAAIRESIVNILHTKDGSRISMHCIWHGTAKDRKAIIKSMKSHVAKICMEEYGHMVLLAIFDCVDDTKLVCKAIIEEMLKSAADLAFHSHGRKVLLYLIAPRDTRHVHPDVIKILEIGNTSTTSKKDPQVRSMELLMASSGSLINLVAEHMERMVSHPSTNFIVQSVLIHCIGDKTLAYKEIAKLSTNPVNDDNKCHIEDAAFHMLLKRLIQHDKMKSEQPNTVFFSHVLLEVVTTSILTTWIDCNRGAFTLLLLLETNIESITTKVKAILKPLIKELSKKNFKGAELLHSKLV